MSNQPAAKLSQTLMDRKVVLMLFHNDLRINDNATLLKAAEIASDNNGRLLCVYASDLADLLAEQASKPPYQFADMGQARTTFLVESLVDLDKSLQRLGNRLLYLEKEHSLQNDIMYVWQIHLLLFISGLTFPVLV